MNYIRLYIFIAYLLLESLGLKTITNKAYFFIILNRQQRLSEIKVIKKFLSTTIASNSNYRKQKSEDHITKKSCAICFFTAVTNATGRCCNHANFNKFWFLQIRYQKLGHTCQASQRNNKFFIHLLVCLSVSLSVHLDQNQVIEF